MSKWLENEYAFFHCFEALTLQGRSYGVPKKIVLQEMHEWKIAWKTSHFVSKFGGCFMIAHEVWFEVSKMIPICFTCDYHVGIKETWLEKLWVKFERFKARSGYLTIFSVACITWTFDIFRNFKMVARAVQSVYKGLKLIIETLGVYLMIKKQICLGNK